jgi:hypothetical protein
MKMTMHVYMFDDSTFYAARNMDEAKKKYASDFSSPAEEVIELSDKDLDRLKVAVTDENDERTGESITFRQHLETETGGKDWDAFFFCGEE